MTSTPTTARLRGGLRRFTTKRAFDLVASGAGLVVGSPLFLAAALAIKVDDPAGPVFFRQQRVGLGGRLFRIHKFRSMSVANSGSLVTSANDARITRVGAILRKSKLDELPQLIDVFVGDMSLVGPRPEVPKYVAMWGEQAAAEILSVRPGITDPASITYRNEQDELAGADDPEQHYVEVILPRKVALYRDYVRTNSVLGDLALIWQTLVAVVRS
ncbi:sugar transferase [Tessaracoccus sp. SD287]|uniref:sugar transferase n=1 Tax=Tessaracoccus sp. SD287 TaxID=2782008 RepID=UPI001A95A669|nr:sugar transferase [Tessaracoccus sp. SD287]MBO1031814.1 sugar transferase [Tessaracoccus sp. SD287]